MGRVGAALEVVLGTPQAISLAVGAGLVSLISYHVVFAIMATFTLAGAVYLVARLGASAFRPQLVAASASPESVGGN